MASTTLYSIIDSSVKESFPDSNYGTESLIIVITLIDDNKRAFVKFNLDSLPVGAIITLAKFRGNCYSVVSLVAGVTDVQARRVADDTWIESGAGSITWNNQPAYGVVEDTQVPNWGWVEWDVTSFVQDEFAGDKVVSICLRCVTEDYDATTRGSNIYSREYDNFDPELYIEYRVPLPLIGKSLIGSPIIGRKKIRGV